jgi:hypothetical protein
MPKRDIKEVKSSPSIEDKLIENLVGLQKVNANMSEKFDKLSEQISRLLALFEMAAKDFSKQPMAREAEKDKEFLDKINMLIEQNKSVAKVLVMLEERTRAKPEQRAQPMPMQMQRSAPVQQQSQQGSSIAQEIEGPAPPFNNPPVSGRPLPKF